MKVVLDGPHRAPTTNLSSSRNLARLLDEARVTGQMNHPGVVPVHELGRDKKGRSSTSRCASFGVGT